MSRCGQEMCGNWNGSGCVCDVFDIDQDERPIVREDEDDDWF